MLICDTSALIAFFDSGEPSHEDVAGVLEADPGPYVVSPYVLAELDHLIATRRGGDAELLVLEELAGGAWDHVAFDAADLHEACGLIDRYRDQEIGLADASLAVLAHRYRTHRLLTLDQRHFRLVRAHDGRPFELLPVPSRR